MAAFWGGRLDPQVRLKARLARAVRDRPWRIALLIVPFCYETPFQVLVALVVRVPVGQISRGHRHLSPPNGKGVLAEPASRAEELLGVSCRQQRRLVPKRNQPCFVQKLRAPNSLDEPVVQGSGEEHELSVAHLRQRARTAVPMVREQEDARAARGRRGRCAHPGVGRARASRTYEPPSPGRARLLDLNATHSSGGITKQGSTSS